MPNLHQRWCTADQAHSQPVRARSLSLCRKLQIINCHSDVRLHNIHGTVAGCRQLIDNKPWDLDVAAQKLLASFATMAVRQLEHASALRYTLWLWSDHVSVGKPSECASCT